MSCTRKNAKRKTGDTSYVATAAYDVSPLEHNYGSGSGSPEPTGMCQHTRKCMTGKQCKRGGAPPVDGAAVMGLEELTEK
jgi:hypothetical protein